MFPFKKIILSSEEVDKSPKKNKLKSNTIINYNFFSCYTVKIKMLMLLAFFLCYPKIWYLSPKKIKTKYIKKKKVDNKFIINSSPCLYSPNESGFFFYI